MGSVIETLKSVAGVMFWALIVLALVDFSVIALVRIVRYFKGRGWRKIK